MINFAQYLGECRAYFFERENNMDESFTAENVLPENKRRLRPPLSASFLPVPTVVGASHYIVSPRWVLICPLFRDIHSHAHSSNAPISYI